MKTARLLIVLIFSSLLSFGATLRVPQDFPTVQAAVAASVTGDTIVISPGLYTSPAAPCTLANGAQRTCGLVLHDGTALVGSGPAQTVLDSSGAQIGILLQNGTATVKLAHLQNAGTALYAYVGSNITATNLIITNSNVGTELNQGNSYTIINTTIDGIHDPSQTGSGVDVPFGGAANIQNNLVTHSDRAFTAGSFSFGTYAFNDAFGSLSFDWGTCTSAGCTPVAAPANNVSFDPLYCPDFSLLAGSAARNAGNPAILNPDGTRSDLGAYGGPDTILPPLVAAPCVVNFGSVQVGSTSSAVNIRLQSTEGVSQTVSGIKTDNAQFTISGTPQFPATVGPNGALSFSITFTPIGSGTVPGNVEVTTSNPFSAHVVLEGLGVGATSSKILRFPVAGYDAYHAPISSVFDHSMTLPYDRDDTVVSYTGDKGQRQYGPGSLSALTGNGQITLNWTSTVGATLYRVLRSSKGFTRPTCSDGQTVYSGMATTITDTGLANGSTYFYRLCITDSFTTLHSGLRVKATPAPTNPSSVAGQDGCDTFKQSSGQPFSFQSAGNFAGAGLCGNNTYLSYDGHPGIDYAFPYRTVLVASTSGLVSYTDTTAYPHPLQYHVLTLMSSDDPRYNVLYLHLSSYYDPKTNEVMERLADGTVTQCLECPVQGSSIGKGDFVGYTGNYSAPDGGWGGVADHLHFEVRKHVGNSFVAVDPYGWQGCDRCDPYPYASDAQQQLWQ